MKKIPTGRALITGASSGIGKEFALQLAALGWSLVIVSRNQNRLEQLRAEIMNAPNFPVQPKQTIEIISADLSLPGAAKAVHRECRERALTIDFLINNAGVGFFGRHLDFPLPAIESMLALNINALTGLSSLFGTEMRIRGNGRIMNIGSLAAHQATPYFASYAASKSYVLSFSLALRTELAPFGVSVTCVDPGYVATNFDTNAGISSERYKEFSRMMAMDAAAVVRVGLKAAFKNKAEIVVGIQNKMMATFFRGMPLAWPPAIMKRVLDIFI